MIGRKGGCLNILEKYYIYKISRDNLHMNDTYIDTYNTIFQTIHELYDRQQHRDPQERYISGNNHTECPYKSGTHLTSGNIRINGTRKYIKKKITYRHIKIANTYINNTSLPIANNNNIDNIIMTMFIGINITRQVSNIKAITNIQNL
jgi:hypothetical protein